MPSILEVDSINEKTAAGGVTIGHDLKLSSGKAIQNAAGTALLTQAGVLDNVSLGSSVTGLPTASGWTLIGSYTPVSKMASDHPLIVGFNGEPGLRAGGTSGSFEEDKYGYVLGIAGLVPGIDGQEIVMQYYGSSAGAYLGGSIYETVSYGYQANSSSNPGTVEGYEHNASSSAKILSGGDWLSAGNDGSISAELKFFNPAPSVSTATKQMTGTMTYFDNGANFCNSTFGVGITTTDKIIGLKMWVSDASGAGADSSVGKFYLYEMG